jgi:hypothetical protein
MVGLPFDEMEEYEMPEYIDVTPNKLNVPDGLIGMGQTTVDVST